MSDFQQSINKEAVEEFHNSNSYAKGRNDPHYILSQYNNAYANGSTMPSQNNISNNT